MNTELVVTYTGQGTSAELAAELRLLADRVEHEEPVNAGGSSRLIVRRAGGLGSGEESTYARYFGVFCGVDAPMALYRDKQDAEIYAEGGKVSRADEDGELGGGDYGVCRVDVCGSWWNSYDEDPHKDVAP